jgi:Sulfotransferase domain
MGLRVLGAGPPRTGTSSLKAAIERLLGGSCYHMTVIPGHPFDLGDDWRRALAGGDVAWHRLFEQYVGAVDWPTSLFWREIAAEHPDALVLLSVRDSARVWWESLDGTILPFARASLAPDWTAGHGLTDLFERFTGSPCWDDPVLLMNAYDRHLAAVRETVPPDRLLQWRPGDGWEPICRALDVPVPNDPFPWRNRRSDWG